MPARFGFLVCLAAAGTGSSGTLQTWVQKEVGVDSEWMDVLFFVVFVLKMNSIKWKEATHELKKWHQPKVIYYHLGLT